MFRSNHPIYLHFTPCAMCNPDLHDLGPSYFAALPHYSLNLPLCPVLKYSKISFNITVVIFQRVKCYKLLRFRINCSQLLSASNVSAYVRISISSCNMNEAGLAMIIWRCTRVAVVRSFVPPLDQISMYHATMMNQSSSEFVNVVQM